MEKTKNEFESGLKGFHANVSEAEKREPPLVPDTANESNFGFDQPDLALGLSVIGGFYLGSSSMTRTCINDDTNFNMFSPTKKMGTS
ncbi:hypothetical protein CFP56_021486 [Quercus suber]|uniref:Uncharacterized protein n=1 Tax=Quercus suber TaxID=58331 RepID=A0AAW0KEZ3_QUESU